MQVDIPDKLIERARDAFHDYDLKQSVIEAGGGPEDDNWDMSWDLWDEADSICADLLGDILKIVEEVKKT